MPKTIQIAVDIPSGVKGEDVKWLVTDFAVDDLGKFRCNIIISGANKVEYTVNGGATDADWFLINGGANLKAQVSYGFDIYVRAGDLINFRTPDVGGTTLRLGRLDSVKDEG